MKRKRFRCKKCGRPVFSKEKLDNEGFCCDCTEDLSFKARCHVISYKEIEENEKENKFWETIENTENNDNNNYDFITETVSFVIVAAIYLFYSKKQLIAFGRLSFLGAFISALFIIVPFSLVLIFFVGLGKELIKPLWHSIVKKIGTRRGAIIFSLLFFIGISIISALIIAIKSRF